MTSTAASLKQLQISSELQMPIDAVTQTFVIFGKRGAGKTNTAVVLAEEMFKAHLPLVVLDPLGAWWGLKASFDGTGPGLGVYVFGGQHGDLPLGPADGAVMADVLVEHRISAVLDMKGWSGGERARFAAAFADRLLKRNTEPLHVFLEEADAWVPQVPQADEKVMLGLMDRMVRWGRQSGLGCTLITQRSAAVNKNVTTQSETLIAHRITGPQDREAIDLWIKFHAGEAKRQEILSTLPTLPSGTAWIWSPEWLEVLKRVSVRRRQTYDSAATPKVGEKRPAPAQLAAVDLEQLRGKLAATIEHAKAEDPKELHKQIAELKRQLSTRKIETVVEQHVKEVPVRVEVPVLTDDHVTRLVGVTQAVKAMMDDLLRAVAEITDAINRGKRGGSLPVVPTPGDLAGLHRATFGNRPMPSLPSGKPEPPTEGLTAPQQRILDALAWWDSVRVNQPRRSFVGMIANASIKSSAFKNNLGALRTAGLLVYIGKDQLRLTDAGHAAARVTDIPRTPEALQATIISRLPRPMGLLLEAAIRAYPEPLSREEAGAQANASPTSSAFKNNLGALRSLGFIDYPDKESIYALPDLFLDKS